MLRHQTAGSILGNAIRRKVAGKVNRSLQFGPGLLLRKIRRTTPAETPRVEDLNFYILEMLGVVGGTSFFDMASSTLASSV
jgi:hypothetical protein